MTDKNITPSWLKEASSRIAEHMNEDHSDVIVATLLGQHGLSDNKAKMGRLETNGYYALSNGKSYFIAFDDHCTSAEEYKQALIKHAHKYKHGKAS